MTGRDAFGADHAFPIRDRFLLGIAARQEGGPERPTDVARSPVSPPPVRPMRLASLRPIRQHVAPSSSRYRGRSGPERKISVGTGTVNSAVLSAEQPIRARSAGHSSARAVEKE